MNDKNTSTCTVFSSTVTVNDTNFKDYTSNMYIDKYCACENNSKHLVKSQNMIKKMYAEKMTYCRPITNMYNQEFYYKTMEKNARLQRLVKKLALVRQKEKQNEAWNNYIKELRKKHGYYPAQPIKIPDRISSTENIDFEYNDNNCNYNPDLYESLLNDVYNATKVDYPEERALRSHRYGAFNDNYKYRNDNYCFPTASQGRLIMLNKERQENLRHNNPVHRYVHRNGFTENNHSYSNIIRSQKIQLDKLCGSDHLCKDVINANISTQTDNILDNAKVVQYNNDHYSKYAAVSNRIDRVKQNIEQSLNNATKRNSLTNIEIKIESLIQTINNFITEVTDKGQRLQDKGHFNRNNIHDTALSWETNKLNETDIDNSCLQKRELICGVAQDNLKCISTCSEDVNNRKDIEEILLEEISKSDKVRTDIDSLLNETDQQRGVQLNIEIPTKDHSTEVTDSLFNTHQEDHVVEEIDACNVKHITIAVNTDPLGLQALLRVSSEAMKQFLAYLPSIDYLSYLSRLQGLPLPSAERPVSRFVCSICGATFGKPSWLRDHIQEHHLGNKRNCCMCRHVVDMKKYRAQVLPCKHCGQEFTRAYCRELHEQACARRTGDSLDVSPSLMMLH